MAKRIKTGKKAGRPPKTRLANDAKYAKAQELDKKLFASINNTKLTDVERKEAKRALARRLPWDRLDTETGEEYRAFLVYCILGLGRTIDKAYNVYLTQYAEVIKTGKIEKTNSWHYWFKKNEWVRRSSEWDRHQSLKTLEEIEAKKKYEVAKHREEVIQDATLLRKTGRKLVAVAANRIKRLEQIERSLPPVQDDLSVAELRNIANNYDLGNIATTLAKSSNILSDAINHKGKALCIDQLLGKWEIALQPPLPLDDSDQKLLSGDQDEIDAVLSEDIIDVEATTIDSNNNQFDSISI
jgi:hypothetical protein